MIILASDHRGFLLKQEIKKFFNDENIITIDVGAYNRERSDFPDFVRIANSKVLEDENNVGIYICGTGIGMSMAANRNPKIRAALCWNLALTKTCREHNDANVLVLPGEHIKSGKAIKIIKTFLTTDFLGGVYAKRNAKLKEKL